ncbi:MAG: sulfotransferase, partial [Caulobacteraceae bacterium]
LQDQSRLPEAADAFRRALAADPASDEARFGLASLAAEAGAWDAGAEIASAIVDGPTADLAWLEARIAMGRGEPGLALGASSRALAQEGLAPAQRAEILLLESAALDALERRAEAFAAASQGKALLRGLYAERAAGREGAAERFHRLEHWFTAADPQAWRSAPAEILRFGSEIGHVFLVGFPRSGTTLLEQALAGHPRVAALEEAPSLAAAFAEFLTDVGGLSRLASIRGEEAERWRALYWREVRVRGVEPAGKVFVDKQPAGTVDLPLIAKLFPRARILFALRDPRDVVLSCFRNSFQMNAVTYAFTDLAETARCYDACMRMAEVFRSILPLAVLDVRHEALIGDFEDGLSAIAGFIGIDFVPSMLEIAATAARRQVRTPRAGKVRAGLDPRAGGDWRGYAAEMAPILPILEPWVASFGYPQE